MNTKALVDRMLRKVHSFPALPTIATQIIRISSDPKASVNDLKKVIEADSSLVVEILKMANSPFFGLRRKVSTIEHCISLLGMSEIKNLVLTKTMFQTFRFVGDFDSTSLWRHSFYCALSARILGDHFQLNPDELFVAGLIHDIGKLILYKELDREIVNELEFRYVFSVKPGTSEENAIGIDHAHLGLKLLEKWMFPDELIIAVGYHHHPDRAPHNQSFALAIHVADIMAHYVAQQTTETEREHLFHLFERTGSSQVVKKLGFIPALENLDIFVTKLKAEVEKEGDIITLLSEEEFL